MRASQPVVEPQGLNVGFRDLKEHGGDDRVSWVIVGPEQVWFQDKNRVFFLLLRRRVFDTIVKTIGYDINRAHRDFKDSVDFRQGLLKKYYESMSDGNPAAKNEIGSGRFRYNITYQKLHDSLLQEFRHAAFVKKWSGLYNLLGPLVDNRIELECYGTTLVNLLKSRGLIDPRLDRVEFERQYTSLLGAPSIPGIIGNEKLTGGSGPSDSKSKFEAIANRLASEKGGWAAFTGMASRAERFRVVPEGDIKAVVASGDVVFVGVTRKEDRRGHYKLVSGFKDGKLQYDDPLGLFGHLFYDNAQIRWALAAEPAK